MTGPSNPRGEHPGRRGVHWESIYVTDTGEHFDDDPAALADVDELPAPAPANRAARRDAARAARRRKT